MLNPSKRLLTLALPLVVLASVAACASGCSSSSDDSASTSPLGDPAVVTKSLSGRYEPVTSGEAAPEAEFAGMSSIWFSGKGDYQIILANCSDNCEELGTYTVDANDILTLNSFTNGVHTFHIDSLAISTNTSSAKVKLQNTSPGGGSGSGTGSGSGDPDAGADNSCSETSDSYPTDDSADDSDGSSDDDSSVGNSSDGSDCTPSKTAGGMGLSPVSPKSGSTKGVGDGKSSSGSSGLKRTGGTKASPTGGHSQTVELLYLGSPAFLKRCAGDKYGCGASVNTYPETDLYFSAPLHTVTCGSKATFCKGSNCQTAVRVESSDSHQHFEGSYGLIKALGDTPVDPASGCSGGSGSISGVKVTW